MKSTPVTEIAVPISAAVCLQLPERLTDEALLWLSAHNPTFTFEQSADGVLIVSPPASSFGNRGELELARQFLEWNERTSFGEVRGISGGVHLPEGGDYEPDVFVVTRAAWEALAEADQDRGFVPVLPLAAFELIPPANVTSTGYAPAFAAKLAAYERSRIPLVVLLEPATARATIRRFGQADEIDTKGMLTFPELPGLELDVAKIYRAAKKH